MRAYPGRMATTEHQGAARAEDHLRLDLQICFSLHAATRAFNGVYRTALKDLGLTYPQYLAMLVLWEHGELPVKRMGQLLRLDSGTLSPLLKRMESAGLVERRRSARDERSVTVRPTGAGLELREQALQVPGRIAAATGYSLEQAEQLRTVLETLTERLDRAEFEARSAEEDAWEGEPTAAGSRPDATGPGGCAAS
ncbi:MarR family winged helix-turn-helix transcriptional regulator [Streptomyces sp. NPDC060194]|uniref:MarR family winged helix-turn-helix transcriptional regulator n=1 Tax=Streptomyces sp. NPDC060194 TaxID=3347069 RepID=UPI00365955CD